MAFERQKDTSILVVEDSLEEFEVILWALHQLPFNVRLHHCRDGDDTLHFLLKEEPYTQATRPTFILLDLNLPGTDGREVLSTIKEDRALKSIPVVVLTTSSSPRDIHFSYQNGANSYITKPLNLQRFLQTLETLLGYWLGPVTFDEHETDDNATCS